MAADSRNKKKLCNFCLDKVQKVDYKNSLTLKRYLTDAGKILPSRITGTCAKHQRDFAVSVKRARQAGLIPYVMEG
jgi:small subunit ribosomal protein S18